jgi:hypothetical protein
VRAAGAAALTGRRVRCQTSPDISHDGGS